MRPLRRIREQTAHEVAEHTLRLGAVEHPAQTISQRLKIRIPVDDVLLRHNLNHATTDALSAQTVQDLWL